MTLKPNSGLLEAAGGAELLAAVIAEPDDVDRRLVYADWLIAQGDPQGELIQLCERRRALGHDQEGLDARIAELERAYREQNAGEIAQLATEYTLDRGFVTRIVMAAPVFGKHGERLLARHPIEQLDLKPVKAKALARLARTPALGRIRILHLEQDDGHRRPSPFNTSIPFDELCQSPHLDALRRFEVCSCTMLGDPQPAFAGLQAPQLRSLLLHDVYDAPQVLAGLAQNNSVHLRELDVSLRFRTNWPPALAAPGFDQLEHLRLETPSRNAGPQLFEGASLPRLVSLELGYDFPPERVHFPSLQRLSLFGGAIDANVFAGLLERHPRLRALRILHMSRTPVSRALELALALPSDHPLAALELPLDRVDAELMVRVRQRFPRDFSESLD